ncbi:hypothetical protein Tco_0646891 [Tanacetum coccineum]
MGTQVTSSSGSVLEEPEIQKLQMQAKIFKENSLNKLNALKSTTQLLEQQSILYQQAFAQLFGDSLRTFESRVIEPSEITLRWTTQTVQEYNHPKNMNSIEQCIIERASHEQELKMTLKKLSERQLQIQQCKVQEVQSSVTSSGDETSSGIVSDEEIDKQKLEAHYSDMAKIQEVLPEESSSTSQPLEQVQNHDENDVFANVRRHSEQPESINDTYVLEKDDSNVTPDSSNICNNDNQDLKAQMQDKNIAISELKKLIENCKGKSVVTQFNKPFVVRQPNAQRIPKPSVLGKPTPFSNSPEMRSFQTKQSVNKTNVSDGLFKQVTQQNLPQIRKQAVRTPNVICTWPLKISKACVNQSSRKSSSNDIVHNVL